MPQGREIALGWCDNSTRTLHRLDKHGGNRVRPFLGDDPPGLVHAPLPVGAGIEGRPGRITIGSGRMNEIGQRKVKWLLAIGQARQARGSEGHPMIGKGPGEDFFSLGLPLQLPIRPYHLKGCLVRLRTGIGENGVIHSCRCFLREELRHPDGGFGRGVKKRRVVRQPFHLLRHRLHDRRAIIADIETPKTGKAVENATPAFVDIVATVPFDHDMRAGPVQIGMIGEG